MALGVWDAEWLNLNSQRRYPLAQDATGLDTTETFELPDDLILDLVWVAHVDDTIDVTKFHLSGISVFSPTAVIIEVGYDGSPVASLSVSSATHVSGTSYRMGGIASDSPFFDSLIHMTVGSLDNVFKQPAGPWRFGLEDGRLEPTTIRPDLRGVTSLRVIRGTDQGDALQGDIQLIEGTNIRLSVSTVDEKKRIRIDAIDGEGLTDDCECADVAVGPPIRTINGVGPGADGNLDLFGDDCISVEEIATGLQLVENCARPCCGCSELEVITATVAELQNRVASLLSFAQNLDSRTEQMQSVILVSRMNTPEDCPP